VICLFLQLLSVVIYILNHPISGFGLACRYNGTELPTSCCSECQHTFTSNGFPCRIDYSSLTPIPYYRNSMFSESIIFLLMCIFGGALPSLWILFVLRSCFRRVSSMKCLRQFPRPEEIPSSFVPAISNQLLSPYIWCISPLALCTYCLVFVSAYYHHRSASTLATNQSYCSSAPCSNQFSALVSTDLCNAKWMFIITIIILSLNFILNFFFIFTLFFLKLRFFPPMETMNGNNEKEVELMEIVEKKEKVTQITNKDEDDDTESDEEREKLAEK